MNKDEIKAENEGGEKEQEKEQTQSSDGLSGVVADIIEKTPSVSEHVIEQEQTKQAAIEAEKERFPDFDPSIHAVDENGHPIPKAGGKGWRLKRGRKKGGTSNGDSTQKRASQLGNFQANAQDHKVESRAAGKAATALLIQTGMVLGGEEWQPIIDPTSGVNEPLMLETAFTDYFAAKEITDFPPNIALAIAVVGYAAPRFAQPKTKTRLQRFGLWIKERIPRRKKRPAPVTAEKTEEK